MWRLAPFRLAALVAPTRRLAGVLPWKPTTTGLQLQRQFFDTVVSWVV